MLWSSFHRWIVENERAQWNMPTTFSNTSTVILVRRTSNTRMTGSIETTWLKNSKLARKNENGSSKIWKRRGITTTFETWHVGSIWTEKTKRKMKFSGWSKISTRCVEKAMQALATICLHLSTTTLRRVKCKRVSMWRKKEGVMRGWWTSYPTPIAMITTYSVEKNRGTHTIIQSTELMQTKPLEDLWNMKNGLKVEIKEYLAHRDEASPNHRLAITYPIMTYHLQAWTEARKSELDWVKMDPKFKLTLEIWPISFNQASK